MPGPKGPGLKAQQLGSPVRTTDFAQREAEAISGPLALDLSLPDTPRTGQALQSSLAAYSLSRADGPGPRRELSRTQWAKIPMGLTQDTAEQCAVARLVSGPGGTVVNLCVNRSPTGPATKQDLLGSYL